MRQKQTMPPLRSYQTIPTYACSVPVYGPRKQASGNAALRIKGGTKRGKTRTQITKKNTAKCDAFCLGKNNS